MADYGKNEEKKEKQETFEFGVNKFQGTQQFMPSENPILNRVRNILAIDTTYLHCSLCKCIVVVCAGEVAHTSPFYIGPLHRKIA